MDHKDQQALARLEIFSWLDQKLLFKPWVTWNELMAGCPTGLGLIPLASSRGIWNPKQFDETLTIMISAAGPYSDQWLDDSVIKYAYQKNSIEGSNKKLRKALENNVPIVVLQRLETSIFLPRYPAYVVEDDIENQTFTIDLSRSISLSPSEEKEIEIDKSYKEQLVRRRIHQPRFRAQVIRAYSETCAICQLKHVELLDAAHILPDAHPEGVAAVRNGLALCKLHHSAYDKNFLGISPDYKVRIRQDLLSEEDGPMLKHGLQAMNDLKITTPKSTQLQPDKDALAQRFELFARAAK